MSQGRMEESLNEKGPMGKNYLRNYKYNKRLGYMQQRDVI
jgi:hypothetical protein